MQRKIKIGIVICLRMGKISKAKTPPGDFQVTTPKNPLLSITSDYKYMKSYQTLWPIPNTNLQLNPYPNT